MYIEYQSVSSFVRIVSPATQTIVAPLRTQVGGRYTSLRWGDPIPAKEQKLWYSMYRFSIIPSTFFLHEQGSAVPSYIYGRLT
jgi:hypothetical protein